MVERLAAESFAFTRHAGSPDDRRAAVAANRLICDQPAKHSTIYRERLAAGSTIYGARAAQQLRSPTGCQSAFKFDPLSASNIDPPFSDWVLPNVFA